MDMEVVVKDIHIASYLLASEKVRLIKTERRDRNQVLFHFSPKEDAEKLISDYWSDTASCTPRKLFSAQRSLKDLIFSGA